MMRSGKADNIRWDLRGGLVVALLMLATIAWRLPTWTDGTGAENIEASYHVLLTMEAYDRSPAREHLFLPIVSLGRAEDKGIAWGATVSNPSGDMVYTSFFPAGFILPYLAFSATGAEFSLRNLALFNAMLGTINAVLFYLLAWRAAVLLAPGERSARLCAIAATLPLIFSAQALASTGLVYWHQCITQIVLTVTGLAVLGWFAGERQAEPVLIVLAFVGPLLEWSALLANMGLFAIIVLGPLSGKVSPRRERLFLAGAIAAATALSLALSFAHFAAGIGGDNFVRGLFARYAARSVAATGPRAGALELLLAYLRSYGLFLIVLALSLPATWRRLARRDLAALTVMAILLVWLAACLENIVMLQHAGEFAFDRFKAALPLGLIVMVALRQASHRKRATLAAGMVIASLSGIVTWSGAQAAFAGWREVNARNRVLVSRIDRLVDLRCALIASDQTVRGQTNLLVMRGVYENTTPERFAARAGAHPACGAVYLHGFAHATDLVGYTGAQIITPTGLHRDVAP